MSDAPVTRNSSERQESSVPDCSVCLAVVSSLVAMHASESSLRFVVFLLVASIAATGDVGRHMMDWCRGELYGEEVQKKCVVTAENGEGRDDDAGKEGDQKDP